MWELILLLGVIAVVYSLLKYRETFVIKYGNPYYDEDLISFDYEAKGTRIFSLTPDTCPADKSEYDAGLCYPPCGAGWNGVGPVCWAETQDVGIGVIPNLMSCDESKARGGWEDANWTDTGLLCSAWIDECVYWDWGLLGGYWTGCLSTKPKFQTCKGKTNWNDTNAPDFIDGLCYAACPKELPEHIPGMPYLCAKTSQLSYTRGVGTVPPLIRFGA